MKKSGIYAVALGLSSLFFQGCFEAPNSAEADRGKETTEATAAATAAASADLVFTSAVITSQTATQINYAYTIRNVGTVTVPNLYNVSIQNFYSANTVFNDAGDAPAGGSIIGVTQALAPGQTFSGTFHASGAVPAGMAYLTFKIDWGNIVAESNESNNTRALSILPDLRFTTAAVTSITATGVNYSYTIRNQGTTTVPDLYNVSIQNFYSANTVFNDAGDVAAGGSILGVHQSLAPGQSYSGTFHSSGAIPAGMGYLTFKIDWGNIVTESNESNNTYALSVLPDLAFTSAVITARTATQVRYDYTIRNNGGAAIPSLYNVSIQNFYSANTVFNDAGDVPAGGSILGVGQGLAPGQSYSGSFYASGAVPAGMAYLTFKIDWGGFVTESNESNNTVALIIP
jgi:subtilase family serine protease